MTPEHFRVIQQAAQRLQVDIIMRLTNTASTPLIELGCPGKPLEVKASTDPRTGVATCKKPGEFKAAYDSGYYVVDADLVARREVNENGRIIKKELKIGRPFWQLAPGQVIEPVTMKPLVGDYDVMDVIDPKSPGANVALVSKNGENPINVESPQSRRVRADINPRLDRPRLLHGGQGQLRGQYGGFRGGAVVFRHDGFAMELPTQDHVEEYYDDIGRETAIGSYRKWYPETETMMIGGEPVNVLTSVLEPATMLEKVASNHAIGFEVAFRLGQLFEWGFDKAVSLAVSNELKTPAAKKEIAYHFRRGHGVLVIVLFEEFINNIGAAHRNFLGLAYQGGASAEAAMAAWKGAPAKLLPGPRDRFEARERYLWIAPPGQ